MISNRNNKLLSYDIMAYIIFKDLIIFQIQLNNKKKYFFKEKSDSQK